MPAEDEQSPGRKPGPKILFNDSEEGQVTASPSQSVEKPRVLFQGNSAEETQITPKEGDEVKGPSVLFGIPTPPTPKGTGPKVLMDGEVRRRIPCTTDDLQQLDHQAGSSVVKAAFRIIQSTNLDDAYFEDAIRFGSELQEKHGAITEEELVLVNAESLQKAQQCLAQMIQLVEDLNPQRVFAVQLSLLEVLKMLLEPPRPAKEVFVEKYPQTLEVARELKALEPRLTETLFKLKKIEGRYVQLIEEIAGYTLAATFIVRYVTQNPVADGSQAHYASQAQSLEARATSLLTTRATVQMGLISNQSLQSTVQLWIDAGRGVLEEDLPAFNTAYTTALAAVAKTRNVSTRDTWFVSVRDLHARITHKLTGDRT